MAAIKNTSKQRLPIAGKDLKPGESVDVSDWGTMPDQLVLNGWRKSKLIEVTGDTKPSEQIAQGNFSGSVKD